MKTLAQPNSLRRAAALILALISAGSLTIADDANNTRRVTLRVLDIVTEKPIPKFKVVPGRLYPQNGNPVPYNIENHRLITWESHRERPGRNGLLELQMEDDDAKDLVSISADGYQTVYSLVIAPDQEELTVALMYKSGVQGVLFLPDGTPASGQTVQILNDRKGTQARIKADGRLQCTPAGRNPATTDDSGKFSFPFWDKEGILIAGSESGFVRVPMTYLARKRPLRLQPHGRVEGRLMKDGRPLKDVLLTFGTDAKGPGKRALAESDVVCKTKEDGSFVFEKVPAGKMAVIEKVAFDLPVGPGGKPFFPGLPQQGFQPNELKVIEVLPGKTTKVRIEHKQLMRGFIMKQGPRNPPPSSVPVL